MYVARLLSFAVVLALPVWCFAVPDLVSFPELVTQAGDRATSCDVITFEEPCCGLSREELARPGVSICPGWKGQALKLEQASTGSISVSFKLPAERIRGAKIAFSAMVKAEKVTTPPASYNGIKVMLHTVGPGADQWLQHNMVWGTFDWKLVAQAARISDDITTAELILGLENTRGRAWFDNVQVSIKRAARVRPLVKPSGPVYTGHNLARLRGAMVGGDLQDEDLRVLGQDWNANLIRWQFTWNGFPSSPADHATVGEYNTWIQGELARLDEVLPMCKKYGLKVVVDVHTSPGGRDEENVCRLFRDKQWQDYFPQLWEKIARRYKGNDVIWGYDLLNEPVEGEIPSGLMSWNEMAALTANRVYAIDPDHAIIVEPAPWGSVASIDDMDIIPLPNIVYSAHMYLPHTFTHQGVRGSKTGYYYPGKIDGVFWDKARLRRVLQSVRDFQVDYGVHIYIGEFSAIRWAPGHSAYNYLSDLIDIFEEFGWDWSYHAYREWNGWSVEHGSDLNNNDRSTTPTQRQKLLMKWFSKNQKPSS